MIKLIFSILILIALLSLSHQSILSQSLQRCRRDTTSTCVLTPEVLYYWNTSLMRQNIAEDRGGISFRLQIVVTDVNTRLPIANAAVTLLHCNALGIYSHYIQASIQLTNASSVATFDTIYSGWYIGRATHMHVKVHLGGTYINASSYYSGANYVHTGQLFFNDTLSNLVNQQSLYSTHTCSRMLNSADNIYATSGAYTLINVQYVNSGNGVMVGLITSLTLSVTSTSSSNVTSLATTVSSSTTSTSKATTSVCGGRAGGSPFWLW